MDRKILTILGAVIVAVIVVGALLFFILLQGDEESRFIGSWQPESVVMGGGDSEETWTFSEGGTVTVVVTLEGETLSPDVYSWEVKNGELCIITPMAPEYTICGEYEFNDDSSFIWMSYYQNDPSNKHSITFNKV